MIQEVPRKGNDLPLPLYRLAGSEGFGFRVDRVDAWVDTESPSYDPDDNWSHCIKAVSLAETTSREAAMAVLRLHEATEYHDLTDPRWHWGAPLTPMEKAA